MKPANWRQYYWYKPSRSLAWHNPPSHDREMTREYLEWLRDARGFADTTEAQKYVHETQKHSGILRIETGPETEPPRPANKAAINRARAENALAMLLGRIRKIDDWPSLAAIQRVLDQKAEAFQ